jgi:fructokinase
MDVICIGELIIDFLPVQSGVRFEDVREFRRVPGGAPANVAAAASKIGMSSAFIGRVGDDRFGRYLSSVLADNGVDISQMQYDSKARTTLAFISLPTPNTRQFLFYRNPGADMNLDYKKFNEDFIRDTRIFHFGSITLINEPARASTYRAVKTAKKAGAVISYDPNLRKMLWPSLEQARKEITGAIPLSDIIKVSHEELKFITGTDELEKGSKIILDEGPAICLVTMGEKGCYYQTGKFSGEIDAYHVDAVDATGCGDSFVSGILSGTAAYGLHKLIGSREELLKTIEFASAAAAITATKKGVIPALPLRKEVEAFLQREKQ